MFLTLSYSQNEFQEGYFIDNGNKKHNVLILNEEWNNSPNSFTYKVNNETKSSVKNIKDIKEFGVNDRLKYVKAERVNIDYSSDKTKNLSKVKAPDWKEKTVMLKVLVLGDASLYNYKGDGINRYFYKLRKSDISQLVYKRYNYGINKVKENRQFAQTLMNELRNCSKIDNNDILSLRYTETSLSKLFIKYNSCNGANQSEFVTSRKEVDFNFKVKGGVNNSSLTVFDRNSSSGAAFDSSTTYRIELEVEFILPFNNEKWSGFFALAKNGDYDSNSDSGNGNAKYSYLEIPFGARHYMYLGDNSRIGLQFGYTFDLTSELAVSDPASFTNINGDASSGSFMFGTGFYYKKFSLELSANLRKQPIKTNTASYDSEFPSFNILMGYSLF